MGNHHASEKTKQALLAHDWHFGIVPDYVAEVASVRRQILQQLRTLARPVLALVPTHWLAPATSLLRYAPMAQVVHTRGVKDEHTLTFNPARIESITTELERFAANSFAVYDAMLVAARASASGSGGGSSAGRSAL